MHLVNVVMMPALLYRVPVLPLEAYQVAALEKRLSDFCMAVAGIRPILCKKTMHTSKGHSLALQVFPRRYVSRVLEVLIGSAPLLDLYQPLSPFSMFQHTVKIARKWLPENPAPPHSPNPLC